MRARGRPGAPGGYNKEGLRFFGESDCLASCVSVCVYSVQHTQQLAVAAQVGDARRVGDPRIRKKMQLMQDHREMKMPNRIKAARETGRR